MKMSELKVGDKFRFFESDDDATKQVLGFGTRNDGSVEVNTWSGRFGFCSYFTTNKHEVELITEPTYKPYSDLRVLAGTVVVCKATGRRWVVTAADEFECLIGPASWVNATCLLSNYTHLDGTPCGELVQ